MSYCWGVYGAVKWTAVWWNPLQNRIPVLQREVSPYASDHVKYRSLIINSDKKKIMSWVRKFVNHCRSWYLHKGSSEPVVHCGFVLCSSMDIERHVLNVWITPSWSFLMAKFSPMPALAWQIGWSVEAHYQVFMILNGNVQFKSWPDKDWCRFVGW